MISVRQVAQECLGVTGTIVVDRDLYGYIFRDNSGRLFGQLSTASNPPETLPDTLPLTGQPTARSLRQHLERIKGKSINLSIVMVGYDDVSGSNTLDDLTKVQYAIQILRDIYAQADLGIRKIYWDRISVAEAGTYPNITDRDHAQALTNDFNRENDGIDAFWVQTIPSPRGGLSPRDGTCDKTSSGIFTGVVITLARRRRRTGILLAHELGHYLGLPGGSSNTNLMGVAGNPDNIDDVSTQVTSSQAEEMRAHCFVRPGC
jgi:hypothetical protein